MQFVLALSSALAWPSVLVILIVMVKWDSWKKAWRRRRVKARWAK
jgi:hypothetical protein